MQSLPTQTRCCHRRSSPIAGSPQLRLGHASRLRCWEINRFFKCPLIGMCLTLAEQKQLLKKTGLLDKQDSAYDTHEKLVAGLDSENRLSRRIDNLLERKFGKAAADLLHLDADAFMVHFKAAWVSGNGAAALWAAAINLALPLEYSRDIFGEIHMAMHWTAEERLQLNHKMTRQQQALNDWRQRANAETQKRHLLQNEIKAHQREFKTLQDELAAMQKEKSNLQQTHAGLNRHRQVTALEVENRKIQNDNVALSMRLEMVLRQAATVEELNRRLSSQLAAQCDNNRRLREETRAIIGEMASLNRCDASCPSFDLCKKRILIVGGITRMESIYRELIESRGGVFEYHDGYVKKGVKDLEGHLKRADVVLCPINCNSHAACSIVKNLGKKHNKPVHMLPNSSLSTVSRVIWGDGGESRTLMN